MLFLLFYLTVHPLRFVVFPTRKEFQCLPPFFMRASLPQNQFPHGYQQHLHLLLHELLKMINLSTFFFSILSLFSNHVRILLTQHISNPNQNLSSYSFYSIRYCPHSHFWEEELKWFHFPCPGRAVGGKRGASETGTRKEKRDPCVIDKD